MSGKTSIIIFSVFAFIVIVVLLIIFLRKKKMQGQETVTDEKKTLSPLGFDWKFALRKKDEPKKDVFGNIKIQKDIFGNVMAQQCIPSTWKWNAWTRRCEPPATMPV